MIKVFFNPKFCQTGDAIKLIISSSQMKVRRKVLGTTQEKAGEGRRKANRGQDRVKRGTGGERRQCVELRRDNIVVLCV